MVQIVAVPKRVARGGPMSEKIREWTLHQEMGRGGMGVVWRATHDILKGEWAVKVMLDHLAHDEEYRRRFLSESTVLASLRHVNIISIQTPFQEDGRLYLPMELLTGLSLGEALNAEPGPWAGHRATDIIRQVAAGLAYVHGQAPPVLHRDIKPENIQLMTGGLVKIFDFGLARPVDDAAATLTGNAIGTPDFMAPELLAGKRATTQSDVFSLGVVMYRLLAGRLPWDIPKGTPPLSRVVALVEAHRAGLPDVRDFAPHVSPSLADLTMRAVARDPASRPVNGGEFLSMLDGQKAVLTADDDVLLVEGVDVDPVTFSWGLGSGTGGHNLEIDGDSPAIPRRHADIGHVEPVFGVAGYGRRSSRVGVGVAIMIVGLILCAAGFAAWWLARDWAGLPGAIQKVEAALTGDRGPGAGNRVASDALSVSADTGRGSGHGAVTAGGGIAVVPAGSAKDVDEVRDSGAASADAHSADIPGPGMGDGARAVDEAAALAAARAEEHSVLAGMAWVRIGSGVFVMGQGAEDDFARPARDVAVPGFEVARHEVTVDQYQKCVEAGVCTAPHWRDCYGYSREATGRTGKIRNYAEKMLGLIPDAFRQADHPVVCVDWDQANQFARWVGGRLPSEAEWEFAARGAGGAYPWGDAAPSCRFAVMGAYGTGPTGDTWGCGREATWPVCSKKAGNTSAGLCDMAGNAMEWVRDAYVSGYDGAPSNGTAREGTAGDQRVCRGGAWYSYSRGVRAIFRGGHNPAAPNIGIGFRPVRPVSADPVDGAGNIRKVVE